MTKLILGLALGLAATALAGLTFVKDPNPHQAAAILLTPRGAIPQACTTALSGLVYYDTDNGGLCICNGTNWLDQKDLSTACT